jgi:hypothetical protein
MIPDMSKGSFLSQVFFVISHPIACLKRNPGDLGHVILSAVLVLIFMLFEVLQYSITFPDVSVSGHLKRTYMVVSVFTGPLSLFICYLLPFITIPLGKRSSWQMSVVLLIFSHLITFFTFYQLCEKGIVDYGRGTDWPIPLAVGKDCVVFCIFAITITSNTWNHVHALRAYIKAFGSMPERRKKMITNLPTIVMQIPVPFYVTATFAWVIVLFVMDYIGHASFNEYFPRTSSYNTLGVFKDIFGIIVVFEIFVWYYIQIARVLKE